MTKVILEQKEYERLLGDFIKKELYKKRIDKAIEYIGYELLCYDNESDVYIVAKKLIEILRGEEDDKTK